MKTQKDILNWYNAYTHTKTHTKVDVRPSKKNDVRFCYFLIGCVENQKQKKDDIEIFAPPLMIYFTWFFNQNFRNKIDCVTLIFFNVPL